MKHPLLLSLAFLAIFSSLAAAPAAAGNLYVPLVDRDGAGGSHQRTEVWIANTGAVARTYTATFLPAGASGTALSGTGARATVAGGRTAKVIGLTTSGRFGLLEINAAPQLQVEARLANTVAFGPAFSTPVPVISSTNVLKPGTTANLLGLSRTSGGGYTDLGVVNVEKTAATCAVALFRADGTQIAGTATITVEPLSLRLFGDAIGLLGETDEVDARAQVACDQTFYPYAAVFNAATGALLLATPAGSGTSTLGSGTTPPPPPPGNALVYTLDGLFHTPTVGNEFKQLVVPVTHALALKRMVIDWDVTPAAFTPGHEDKNHNLIWVYRGRNRSNTIANMNVFGPQRNEIKNTTNVDVPPAGFTSAITPLAMVAGTLYHIHYVYDAENAVVTTTVTSGGVTVAVMTQGATAANRTLTIPAPGFNVNFGNGTPQIAVGEYPTYGWKYANLRIEMVPY
jgi:hypothetical protein